MGRSKSKSSPTAKQPIQLDATPKNVGQMVTPGKSGTKRPLPQESDSEGESHELKPENGFLKGKKGKFTLPEDDSTGDISAEVTEDSDDEDADSDINNEEGTDEEEDVDDEDEDDDEDDDEDEDEEDDDESESEADGNKPIQNAVSVKLKGSQPLSAQTHASKTPVHEVQKLDSTKKALSDKHKGPVIHLLIPNPPRDFTQLTKAMSDRGYPVEHMNTLNLRVAVATVPANKDPQNLVSGGKALSVDGKTVHFIRLDGSTDAIEALSQGATDTILVTGIPKFVTMEMLLAKLPRGCQPVSQNLLTKGARNQHFNAAFLGFSSKSDSAIAFNALMNVKFGDRVIRVAYSQPRESSNTVTDKPAQQSQHQLRVLNAPQNATTEQILALFPGAIKADRTNEGNFFINFADHATLRAAVTGPKVLKKNVLKLEVRGGLDGNTMLIKNIPFDASEAELRAVYPDASRITLNRRTDGAFNGSAIVQFSSATAAQSAISKNVTMKSRRLFGHPAFVELPAGKATVVQKQSSPKVKEIVHKQPQKSEAPPQVGSASEDEADEDEDETMEENETIQHPSVGKSVNKKTKEDSSEDEGDDDDDDEDEEDEDEQENESDGSEDEGIEDASDEDMPMNKSHGKSNFTPSKKQFGGLDKKNRASHFGGGGGRGGGRGFSPRGRGFGGGGGRGGPHRGGRGGGFKHRGGGGDRGRGNFQRGRGNQRGQRG